MPQRTIWATKVALPLNHKPEVEMELSHAKQGNSLAWMGGKRGRPNRFPRKLQVLQSKIGLSSNHKWKVELEPPLPEIKTAVLAIILIESSKQPKWYPRPFLKRIRTVNRPTEKLPFTPDFQNGRQESSEKAGKTTPRKSKALKISRIISSKTNWMSKQ